MINYSFRDYNIYIGTIELNLLDVTIRRVEERSEEQKGVGILSDFEKMIGLGIWVNLMHHSAIRSSTQVWALSVGRQAARYQTLAKQFSGCW